MRVLAVGSGQSGAILPTVQFADYDVIACMNGAVLSGGPFQHYFATHPDCYKWNWFNIGITTAKYALLHTSLYEHASTALIGRPTAPDIDTYLCMGTEYEISVPPGEHYGRNKQCGSQPIIACHGTGLHAILHHYSWLDDVKSLTLLGFEHSPTSSNRLHFYTRSASNSAKIKWWRKTWKPIIGRSVTAINLARARIDVQLHPQMGGALSDALK